MNEIGQLGEGVIGSVSFKATRTMCIRHKNPGLIHHDS
jgi:hypothetical protein